VKWAGWTRTKIKDPAKIDKVIHTYVLCHFLASDCVTSHIDITLHKYYIVFLIICKQLYYYISVENPNIGAKVPNTNTILSLNSRLVSAA